MKIVLSILLIGIAMVLNVNVHAQEKAQAQEEVKEKKGNPEFRKLTEMEKYVILQKGTEYPFTGEYYKYKKTGTYVCKQCGSALYKSTDKFESDCGWPSFDDEIKGAVTKTTDADGMRTEINCSNCGGHLGHVFYGERFTSKNTRHCVNSVSLDFIPANKNKKGGL